MQFACEAASATALRAETRKRVPLNRAAHLLLILRCDRRLCSTPTALSGGISVSAIAASFDQPFETTRRHVNSLIDDGICERRNLRIAIRQEMFERPAFRRLLSDLRDIMTRFAAALASAGVALPHPRARDARNPFAAAAAAIDLALAGYEYGAPQFETWLQMRTLNAIFAGNSRGITADSDLARRFADEAPLTSRRLLVPVTPTEIAAELDLSVATARRQIRAAIEDGLVERHRGGVVYTAQLIELFSAGNLPEAASHRALMAIERLANEGVRLDAPQPG